MSNLISMGNYAEQDAMRDIDQVAQMEEHRNNLNTQLDQQYKAQRTSNVATGAGLGWMAGGKMLGGAAGSATAAGSAATGAAAAGATASGAAATGAAASGGAAGGAQLGAWAGPVGAVAGAAIGYLATRLF